MHGRVLLKFGRLVYHGSLEAKNCENLLPLKSKMGQGAQIGYI